MKFEKLFEKYMFQIDEEFISRGKIIFSKISEDKKVVWAVVMEKDHYRVEYSGGGKNKANIKVKFKSTEPDDIRAKLKQVKNIVKASVKIYQDSGKLSLINLGVKDAKA